MRLLHIINGDCALDGWLQAEFDGEVLVWRENYLQGVIPETCDIEQFNRIRSAELHRFAPEKSPDEIFAELQQMHNTLFSLDSGDELVLWLDCCPFDQALEKRLMELISTMPCPPHLYLVREDVVWDREAFRKYSNFRKNSILNIG